MSELKVSSVKVQFGANTVLNNIHLHLPETNCAVLLGSSGSGKTSLLRAIAGFLPYEGSITWQGKKVLQPHEKLIAGYPSIQLITQDFELLPMLTAFEHVYQGASAWEEDKKSRTANSLLKLFGLTKVSAQPVRTLSGGQQQRVALAKCLAADAAFYLFDEAFSQLDLATRYTTMLAVKKYLRHKSKTALFVVHDPLDAFYLADYVFILHKGKIAQKGLTQTVYQKPNSVAIAKLFGLANVLPIAVSQSIFSTPRFHQISGKTVFRPHEVRLKDLKQSYIVCDCVPTPKGKLLQVAIADTKIWIEDATEVANL